MSDWANHLGTLFPEVRLKRYLEMRGADAGPAARLRAVGLLGRPSLRRRRARCGLGSGQGLEAQERQALRDAVPRQALQTPFRTQTAGDIARRALMIARAGLEARNVQDWEGRSEAHFLDQLDAVVDSGVTAADRLLSDFRGPWDGEIDRVFDTNAY